MKRQTPTPVLGLVCLALGGCGVSAQQPPPDPFEGVAEKLASKEEQGQRRGWLKNLVGENLGFRKEVMSEFVTDSEGEFYSRQSLGFEVLKKFSTRTKTVAAFNFQGRLVRRDGFIPVQNDKEGASRAGWTFEYHNFYLDVYNLRRVNLRAGRFYVPFGFNLQTDTHGTVLQLSNEELFGFERDWYAGIWGPLNRYLKYDAYYLVGSGYDLAYRGQHGMGAARVSLSDRVSSRLGLEGGVSVIGGERVDMDRKVVETQRAGFDGRWRRAATGGLVTVTDEFSWGNERFMQLEQLEYLRASRRWGVAGQYRHGRDAAVIGEFTWYRRNDVGNSSLHWVKANVAYSRARTVVTLQYYFYR